MGVKHLEVKQLWIQEARERMDIALHRIDREKSAADALASFSTGPTLAKQLRQLSCREVGEPADH